jgi:outer membrane protein TolC
VAIRGSKNTDNSLCGFVFSGGLRKFELVRARGHVLALKLILVLNILVMISMQCSTLAQSQADQGSSLQGEPASEAAAAERLRNFVPKVLPPEVSLDHNINKVLDLAPLRQVSIDSTSAQGGNSAISIGRGPIKLEASYNEALSLDDAIALTLAHSLPIKISKESLNFQHFQFIAQAVDVLPNFSTGFNVGQALINSSTTAYNRVFSASVRYPVFQGGQVLYSTLAQYYRRKGWVASHNATINDALLDVYKKYSTLLLNRAILEIRSRAFALSESQLALNDALFQSGNGTQFAVMQSRTQLAADRQAMVSAQVALRQSAMALGFALNMPMAINIVPDIDFLAEDSIVGEDVGLPELLAQALVCRPELRQFEAFRLAAARNVQLAASGLYPSVSLFTTYTHSVASVFPAANTQALNGLANASINASISGTGTASNQALNQTASFSPTGNNLGNAGANTTVTVVAASGGNPIATTQSGSLVTSGAVAPSFASGSSAFGTGTSNINGSNTAGAGIFPGLFNTFQAGVSLVWSLSNLGSGNITSIAASRALARQALVQANQELLTVQEQVRSSYLATIAARQQIDSAASGAASTGEALRLAFLRRQAGTGTNLELIQAQRDYINALLLQAQAIVASNQAQVQLLHDTGLISRATILHGYKAGQAVTGPKSKKKKAI